MNQLLVLLQAGAASAGGAFSIFVIYGLIFLIFWFLIIRPQRKKQQEIDAMQDAIEVGDSVLTTGGLFGKIVDIVNDVFIVEFGTNKSVRIPVQKAAIASVREPDLSIAKETKEYVEETEEEEEDI